jgi:hypothetical protein
LHQRDGLRSAATALLDLEPQLRRIKDYEALPLLQQVLHQYVVDSFAISA